MTDERTETEDVPGRALARLAADSGEVMAIIPRDINEAQRYASGLIAANQVPTAFRTNPKDANSEPNGSLILMGVLKSMEVGLPPQTGLEVLLPLNGRFSLWGDGPIGLALRSGKVKNYTEQQIGPTFDVATTELAEWPNDYGFEVRIWRVGMEDPFIGRFTVADAKRQRLWLNTYKKPWIESPRRMLKIRARAFAIRDGFADALMGLGIMEEIEDALPPPPETVTLKSEGPAPYLSDEPVTDDAPALTDDSNRVETDEGDSHQRAMMNAPEMDIEPRTRDLGSEADMKEDF